MARPYSRRPTPAAMERACAEFNSMVEFGTEIGVFTGSERGVMDWAQVVQPGAYVLGTHTPVVQVRGISGVRTRCISMTHVRLRGALGKLYRVYDAERGWLGYRPPERKPLTDADVGFPECP
jgi:hypothetical protein